MYETIKKYTSAFSVTGREKYLADIIESDLSSCADNITRDAMGNLIVYRKGKDNSKKLMIAAHMDEIGFLVTFIEDNFYNKSTITEFVCEGTGEHGYFDVDGVLYYKDKATGTQTLRKVPNKMELPTTSGVKR